MKKTKYETTESTAVVVQFTKKRMILFIYLRCWVSVESCDKKKYDLSQLDDDSMVVQGLIPSPHSEKVLVSF